VAEIEPVFVGLVIASFAFLYPQLSKIVDNMISAFGDEERGKKTAEYVRSRLMENGWFGKDGISWDDFVPFYMRIVGKIWMMPMLSLLLYLMSVVVLVIGFWSDYSLVIGVGLVLLIGALLVCGGQLIWIRIEGRKGYEDMGKWLVGRIGEGSAYR